MLPGDLLRGGTRRLGRALAWARPDGFRNAQATVLAPTGTIGLLDGLRHDGHRADFALVKFKKLAGGGEGQDRQPARLSGR